MQPPSIGYIILLYVLLVWTLFWKGVALWRASKVEQRNWFIVLLVFSTIVNTAGLLEIAYLFYFCKKKLTIAEVKSWKNLMSFKKSS